MSEELNFGDLPTWSLETFLGEQTAVREGDLSATPAGRADDYVVRTQKACQQHQNPTSELSTSRNPLCTSPLPLGAEARCLFHCDTTDSSALSETSLHILLLDSDIWHLVSALLTECVPILSIRVGNRRASCSVLSSFQTCLQSQLASALSLAIGVLCFSVFYILLILITLEGRAGCAQQRPC